MCYIWVELDVLELLPRVRVTTWDKIQHLKASQCIVDVVPVSDWSRCCRSFEYLTVNCPVQWCFSPVPKLLVHTFLFFNNIGAIDTIPSHIPACRVSNLSAFVHPYDCANRPLVTHPIACLHLLPRHLLNHNYRQYGQFELFL